MALLSLAAEAAREDPRFSFAVAHVDHGLRGKASAADAAFVRREAARRRMPFSLARAPVKAFAAREKTGIEESARILRYRALAAVARARRCGAVLTAHTLNDQAETVFMNLVRGAGPSGLAGMAPAAPWPVPVPGRAPRLLRPLLDVPRERLVKRLRAEKTPFRTDATNAEPVFFRNRVRPALAAWERERPGLFERVGRLAALLRDEEAYWESRFPVSPRRLDLGLFKRYHIVEQRRILRRKFGFASFQAVERARAFALDAGPATRQSVPGGWVEKKGGSLVFRPLHKGTP
jgi:tRNA(Ile)-lysidine synthetase-like protein